VHNGTSVLMLTSPALCRNVVISKDKTKFVKFVNGILNETNTLITEALSKLQDIRQLELDMVRGGCVVAHARDAVFNIGGHNLAGESS